jgi:hypothetical protein
MAFLLDDLTRKECVWARKLSPDEALAFESMVELAVRASVPHDQMVSLHEAWSGLDLQDVSFKGDRDERWNTFCTFRDENPTFGWEADSFLDDLLSASELKGNAEKQETLRLKVAQFIKELKYCALFTVWQVIPTFCRCTATLPPETRDRLCEELFCMAVIELLCQLS